MLDADQLWIIPEREAWERELWVWSDFWERWILAPRAKVWREGEINRAQPLLRVGLRPSAFDVNPEIDVPYVGDSDGDIARAAVERAGIALPYRVTLVRYLTDPHRYTTTITVQPEDN